MRRLRTALAVARADVRQRSRNRTLLIVPALIGYLGYLIAGGRWNLAVGRFGTEPELYSGVPDAAWYAGAMSLAGTTLLVLFGYFLLSGSLEEDRRSGVGLLVATTPVDDASYVIGKWLGHVWAAAVVIGGLMLAAAGMFLVRGSGTVDLWGFVSPFLLATFPAMVLVAASTVLLETLATGREAIAGFVYFVAAGTVLSMALPGGLPRFVDPFGIGMIRDSMVSAAVSRVPELDRPLTLGFTNLASAAGSFRWGGIPWSASRLTARFAVFLPSALAVALAVVSFDRFGGLPGDGQVDGVPRGSGRTEDSGGGADVGRGGRSSRSPRFPSVPAGGGWMRLLRSELRLSLRDRGRWWYAAAVAAVATGGLASAGTAMDSVLPLAWLLGLPVWAELGVRERRERTAPLIYTSPMALRQLAIAWLASVSVALALAGGVGLRVLLDGDPAAGYSLATGSLAIPALALALGSLTGGRRAFEAVYLVLWYLGPVNGVEALDYTSAARTGHLWLHVVATVLLLAVGLQARRSFLRR